MIRWQQHPATHIHASLLLAVFVAGLLITSLTRHWMASVPFHDHLVLGPLTADWIHHAHGHAASQRGLALRWQVASGAGQKGARVISLAPGNAVQSFALSSFLLQSLISTLVGFLPAADGRRVHPSSFISPRGIPPPPPVPPPRPT